jgi:hypothetical protein
VCLFYNGYAHGSPPNAQMPNSGRIDYSISTDEGYTWSTPQVLYDSPADDHDASITRLKNGELAVTFFKDYYSGGVYTGSAGVMFMTSNNVASGWSTPRRISPDTYFASSPIRELSNGDYIGGIYRQSSTAANGAVLLSSNQGATWSAPPIDIPLPPPDQQQFLCAETDVIQLKDSNGNLTPHLYAVQRTNFDSAFFSTSADFGKSWSQSQAMGFNAHAPYLHRAPDDTILLAYRNYYAGTTSLRYSLDECQTWSNEVVVDTVGGAYPSIVDLKDGSQLIAYYEEGTGSDIRLRRFLATPGGIEWLPVTPLPEPPTAYSLLAAIVGLMAYAWRKRR